ncbi:DNA-binding response regulator [Caulobacter vibrioides]|uniref:DNA-binding response regulator n=1 Tax=Caulobacter vibrioides TaxID=155892 RepID=A0A290MUF1_CAUVI|nr:winged helix-turn-helix domain-containing protein [Caulobacter vibrioides]ATC31997.1 DNA-binding response regulator [Caulobacter vibrioides]
MSALRHRILVIDDEPQIHRFLGPALDAAGYEALRADSGQEGLRGIALWSPDAVVLDLGLPDMDGKAVLEKARAFYEGPILILSARDREVEKIEALDRGANDYVEKPFGVGELLARLRVALRQSAAPRRPTGPMSFGEVIVDLERRLVTKASVAVKLSPKEFELLTRLALSPGKVLTHKELLVSVWGAAHAEDTQYLRVFVGQLRQKLEDDPAHPALILTEPGVGYRLQGLAN